MLGVIANLPPAAREQRLQELSDALGDAVEPTFTLHMDAALDAVAARLRIARSEVKRGLNHGLARGALNLDHRDHLSAVPRACDAHRG
ncbi:hypothetical protein SAMN04488590_3160 [Microbacterium sp. 77mftsu3.1]|nr:hypothetical protein SAMN04488590_3160 [Microbacterium sp. 77mftsu3.1]